MTDTGQTFTPPRLVDPHVDTPAGLPTADEIRAAAAEAADAGFAAGYADGVAAAVSEAAAAEERRRTEHAAALDELARAAAALQAASVALDDADRLTLDDTAAATVALAVALAEAFVGRELTTVDDAIAARLTAAIGLAPARGVLEVRLHPDDVERITTADVAPTRDVTVVGDASVPCGDAAVEVGPCRVDAQVAEAFARLRSALAVATPDDHASAAAQAPPVAATPPDDHTDPAPFG